MEEPLDPLPGLLSEVAALQREQLRRAELLPQIRARLARLEGSAAGARSPRRRSLPRRWLPLGAVGLAALTAALALRLREPARLSFVVGDHAGAGRVGEILAARPEATLPVDFSDGSRLTLGPGSRLQVRAVAARGATLAMNDGAVEVEVVHRPDTHWMLEAGPFDVTVTGTRFRLAWDAGAEALTIEMHEGSVDVSGGVSGAWGPTGHCSVRAGQRLRATRASQTVGALAAAPPEPSPSLSPSSPSMLATPAILVSPPAPSPPQAATARAVREAAAPAAPDDAWRRLAGEARYREALRAAERGGFAAACRRLGAGDLVLLGDIARLAGDPARAEKAYLTARSRFPSVDRPVFALGLTAFEERRDFGRAAGWFELYQRQFPNGPLGREAAGRALESWRRAGDTERARQAARDYLARYPAGPHAALARQTVGS